ncbi:MAG TPA: hypothetical protein VGL92_05815 [Acidimicrobiia bacterium]|jgi:hypothetical protein
MESGEEFRPEANQPVAAAPAGRGPVSPEFRETGGQVMWGVWKLFFIIIAAFLGAMAVEAARALL